LGQDLAAALRECDKLRKMQERGTTSQSQSQHNASPPTSHRQPMPAIYSFDEEDGAAEMGEVVEAEAVLYETSSEEEAFPPPNLAVANKLPFTQQPIAGPVKAKDFNDHPSAVPRSQAIPQQPPPPSSYERPSYPQKAAPAPQREAANPYAPMGNAGAYQPPAPMQSVSYQRPGTTNAPPAGAAAVGGKLQQAAKQVVTGNQVLDELARSRAERQALREKLDFERRVRMANLTGGVGGVGAKGPLAT